MGRANNGAVERYWGILKKDLSKASAAVGELGPIRLSNYVNFIERRISLQIKTINYKIPSKTTKERTLVPTEYLNPTSHEILQCQDNYKNRNTETIFFRKKNINRCLANEYPSNPSKYLNGYFQT